jgi:7,8-dihydroneopterin aldolase/epimerase/oxygenase
MQHFPETPADTIFIRGLSLHGHHGLLDHEAEIGQRFVIDLELQVDLSEAIETDDLGRTIDYSLVVATATRAFLAARHTLLERAGAAIADSILETFDRARAVSVTVHKPQAPIVAIFDDVGIRITRRRATRLPQPAQVSGDRQCLEISR